MRPRIKREPHLKGETAVQYEVRLKAEPGTFASLSDSLLKRYVTDFIFLQQKASPFYSLIQKRDAGSKTENLTMKFKKETK